MISSDIYLKSAESCFEKCKSSPTTVDTYAQVTNECRNNLINFTQELIENFKTVLIRLDEEDKKVKDQVHNLNSVTLHFESYLERRRRCTIGTICSPSPMENLTHFINNSPNSNVRNISKFVLSPAKLQNLTCSEVNLQTAKIDLKSCYMTETECANNQLPSKLNGISCKKLQNNLSTLSPTSSFWNISETGKMPFKINAISIPSSNLLVENAALIRNVKILSSINFADLAKPQKFANQSILTIGAEKFKESIRSKDDTTSTLSEPVHLPPKPTSPNNLSLPKRASIKSSQNTVTKTPFELHVSPPMHRSPEKEPDLSSFSDDSISAMSLPPPPPDDMIDSIIPESDADFPPPPILELSSVSSPSPPPKKAASPVSYQVVALYSYDKTNDVELSFIEGDVITIIQENPNQWDVGMLKNKRGFVPRNFIKKI